MFFEYSIKSNKIGKVNHSRYIVYSGGTTCDYNKCVFFLVSSNNNHSNLPAPGTTSVFPLPGTFPWAHSSRGKPRRGMMRRAVFSDLQRKGLEKRFQIQKYISKPDRKKLAEKLGLKDSQVSDKSSCLIYPCIFQ